MADPNSNNRRRGGGKAEPETSPTLDEERTVSGRLPGHGPDGFAALEPMGFDPSDWPPLDDVEATVAGGQPVGGPPPDQTPTFSPVPSGRPQREEALKTVVSAPQHEERTVAGRALPAQPDALKTVVPSRAPPPSPGRRGAPGRAYPPTPPPGGDPLKTVAASSRPTSPPRRGSTPAPRRVSSPPSSAPVDPWDPDALKTVAATPRMMPAGRDADALKTVAGPQPPRRGDAVLKTVAATSRGAGRHGALTPDGAGAFLESTVSGGLAQAPGSRRSAPSPDSTVVSTRRPVPPRVIDEESTEAGLLRGPSLSSPPLSPTRGSALPPGHDGGGLGDPMPTTVSGQMPEPVLPPEKTFTRPSAASTQPKAQPLAPPGRLPEMPIPPTPEPPRAPVVTELERPVEAEQAYPNGGVMWNDDDEGWGSPGGGDNASWEPDHRPQPQANDQRQATGRTDRPLRQGRMQPRGGDKRYEQQTGGAHGERRANHWHDVSRFEIPVALSMNPGMEGEPVPSDRFVAWAQDAWDGFLLQPVQMIVAYLIVMAVSFGTLGILMGPMMVGFFVFIERARDGENPSPFDVFEGFEQLAPSIKVGLLVVAINIIMLAMGATVGLAMGAIPLLGGVLAFLARMVFFVVNLALFPVAALAFGLRLHRELEVSTLDIFKAVLRVVWMDPVTAVIYGASVGVLAMAGSILMGVGGLVTGPMAMWIISCAYDEIFEEPVEDGQ